MVRSPTSAVPSGSTTSPVGWFSLVATTAGSVAGVPGAAGPDGPGLGAVPDGLSDGSSEDGGAGSPGAGSCGRGSLLPW